MHCMVSERLSATIKVEDTQTFSQRSMLGTTSKNRGFIGARRDCRTTEGVKISQRKPGKEGARAGHYH